MPRKDCVTIIGLQRIASELADAPIATHIALGDDDTASQVSDLTLGNETYRIAIALAQVHVSTRGLITITASDIGTGDQTIREIGLFDAAVGGNMICRHVLDTAIVIGGSQKVGVVYNLVQGIIE
jgi:hypothetical protein